MSTLVIGDVHGCAGELSELLDVVQPTDAVLVGDLFTKGPDPVGVYELIRGRGMRTVLGNHDARVLQAAVGKRTSDHRAHQAVGRLDQGAPGWREWLAACPVFLEVEGWTVVHAGLHPSGKLSKTTRKMALTMRRFPDESLNSDFWHAQYRGERRTIFGHDARRGLVRVERAGKPHLIGLDSGCVYGGALSGYLIDDDRVVTVKARRPYRPI